MNTSIVNTVVIESLINIS